MLFRLAQANVRRAGRDYLVYLLTLTLAVLMFYTFNTIAMQIDYVGLNRPDFAQLLGSLIGGVTVFLAGVMGFLLVYANNFIMKRRKKQFGLYQVLGMSRGQVARVMALETIMVSVTALALGITLGVGLSQVMVFFTASIFKTQISNFHFFFSTQAFLMTVVCLVAMFAVTLIFNLRVVAKVKIIDLMSANRQNETVKMRNPWISAAVFVLGLVLIIVAYVRLLHDGLPIDATTEAFAKFLITTITVIIGTILFFFGFSGFLLKLLSMLRGLYWRGLNMVTLRQLSSRVNTASFSMAVISFILFLAITSVTGGMGIASALSDMMGGATPGDYGLNALYAFPDVSVNASLASNDGDRTAQTTVPVNLMQATRTTGNDGKPWDLSEVAGQYAQIDTYWSVPVGAHKPDIDFLDLLRKAGAEIPLGMEHSNATTFGPSLIKESTYNAYLRFRGLPEVSLGEQGYLFTSDLGDAIVKTFDAVMAHKIPVNVAGHQLFPVADKVDQKASNLGMGQVTNGGTLVVPDAVIDAGIYPVATSTLVLKYRSNLDVKEADSYITRDPDLPKLYQNDNQVGFIATGVLKTEIFESSNDLYGMVSYLAIYIGFTLVIACAAILAIQQLAGVSDAGRNYRVLSELGTPTPQIMRSALAQQSVFFFFPLAVGFVHACVALTVVVRLIEAFGGFTISWMFSLIFVLAYGGYFLATYIMSKSMIRDAILVRHTV
ncbi:ABC transporter permease [Collinsella sp. zg1085]|uniref:FtsX-like permease family protein n=1 Tax=Collinsella sp. zg1085 TaxID=2844380 RepID=UPI001C0BDB87|nr:ABC transporter permease [Collinsella sp. zg1085]QWT17353.1 ABC transporter permease [Collinsella sp. zg1085]